MTLDRKALAWTVGLLWGGAVFVVALFNLIFPSYGVAFLEWSASIYPGYHGPAGIGSVFTATMYGLVDGIVCGWLLAWLYNAFAGGRARE